MQTMRRIEDFIEKHFGLIQPDDHGGFDDVRDYMRFVKFCLKTMAMLPPFEPGQIPFSNLVNWLYIIFVNFITIYISAFGIIYLVYFDGTLIDTMFGLINVVIYITTTLLLFYFQIYKNESIRLMDKLNSTFKFESKQGLTMLNMWGSFLKARRYSILLQIAGLVAALHWAIAPLLSTDGPRILPVNIWYPVDVRQSPYYEIAYLSQLFGQIIVAVVFSTFDVFFMTHCILICGQFDILCCSLRNLRYTALLKRQYPVHSLVFMSGYEYCGKNRCTLPEDEWKAYFSGTSKIMDPIFEVIYNEDRAERVYRRNLEPYIPNVRKGRINYDHIINETFDTEIKEAIIDCVIHHQAILKYCKEFDSFISPVSLFKMLQITMLTCFVMYVFSESFQIPVLEYLILCCIDLFFLCYFGNEIIIRSVNVGTAVCGGPWQLLSKRSLKLLFPLMIRSSKPVCFTGGKFYRLTLDVYLLVLKGSFSYFTVLRTVNEGKSVK